MPGTKPALYKYTVRRGADKTWSCFPEGIRYSLCACFSARYVFYLVRRGILAVKNSPKN